VGGTIYEFMRAIYDLGYSILYNFLPSFTIPLPFLTALYNKQQINNTKQATPNTFILRSFSERVITLNK